MSSEQNSTKTLATIRTGKAPTSHQGSESWAIETIFRFSHVAELDVDAREVTVLRADKSGTSPTGMRWVMWGGEILGSYSLEVVS